LWLAVTAFLAAACNPSAVSLRPLYTPADLQKALAEHRIEGEWISPNVDEAGNNAEPETRLKIRREQYGYYSVEVRPGKPEPEKGERVTTYNLRLVALGDKLFFDAEFWERRDGQRVVGREEYLGLAPVHVVGRIWPQRDFLRAALLSSDWVRDNTPDSFREVSYTGEHAQFISVIVCSTEELRNFLMQNADNTKAFADFAYFCRPGTDCALLVLEDMLVRASDDDSTLADGADFFVTRGNYSRAAELQRHRAELLPKQASLRADVGRTLLFKRDFEGARREFAAAEQLAAGDSFAPEGIVWSYFLEGKFAEAVTAAVKYKATEKYTSASPILLSYFPMLRLGRRADAELWLKQQADRFAGLPEDLILLLRAQGRVKEACGVNHPGPATDAERWCWLLDRSAIDTSGKWARWSLDNAVSQVPNDSLVALAAKMELDRLPAAGKK
jgi:Tfp pilus assembly protein PilF